MPSLPTRIRLRPLRDFLATEASGGIVLVTAALLALVWANSPWSDSYHRVWSTAVGLRIGSYSLSMDIRHWLNEGLMAIFFLVVGLERQQGGGGAGLRDGVVDPGHHAVQLRLDVVAFFANQGEHAAELGQRQAGDAGADTLLRLTIDASASHQRARGPRCNGSTSTFTCPRLSSR